MKKKLLFVIIVFFPLGLLAGFGDVNGDDLINGVDINLIGDFVMGKCPSNFNIKEADINEDDQVNVADIVQLINRIHVGKKIIDFSSFIGNDWSVSKDKRVARTMSKGFSNKLMSAYFSAEDEFNLSVSFIPTGSYYKVGIGKFDNTAGTMFEIEKDVNACKINIYRIYSSSTMILGESIKLSTFLLSSDEKYWVNIKKRTANRTTFSVTISDNAGNIESVDFSSLSISDYGSAWGKCFVALITGDSLEVSDFSFGYPVSETLDLVIIGHSYVEGNSISEQKQNRYAAKVKSDFKQGHCLILGKGGESAANYANYFDWYKEWFSNCKYVLIDIGVNDLGNNPTKERQQSCIQNCEVMRDKLLSKGIVPIWMLDSGSYENYQNGVDNIAIFHDWIMQQKHYIDVRECFRSGNSNDASKYLNDLTHPTVETHNLIYNCIKTQAKYIFDN